MPGQRMTQAQRRAETRAALVEAAAEQFALWGFDAVSVDAVSEAAGRTSGAVYDHFGSKQGLLLAVLDEWRASLVSVLAAEFEAAATLGERLRAVASKVVVDPSEDTRRLLLLEHELALRAARDPAVAAALQARAGDAHRRLVRGFARWRAEGVLPPGAASPDALAATVRALVLGMAMEQRLDPRAFDVDSAAAVLAAGLFPAGTSSSPAAPTSTATAGTAVAHSSID